MVDSKVPMILKAPAKVLGYVSPNLLRVIVLPGVGMVDGGIQHDLHLDIVPPDLRMPNSEFRIHRVVGSNYQAVH